MPKRHCRQTDRHNRHNFMCGGPTSSVMHCTMVVLYPCLIFFFVKPSEQVNCPTCNSLRMQRLIVPFRILSTCQGCTQVCIKKTNDCRGVAAVKIGIRRQATLDAGPNLRKEYHIKGIVHQLLVPESIVIDGHQQICFQEHIANASSKPDFFRLRK